MQDSELVILLPKRKRTKRNPFFHSSRPTSTNDERLQKHGGTVATLSIRPASFNPSSSRWITDNRIASAIPNNWSWTMRVFLVAAEHGLLRLYNYLATTNQQVVGAGFLAMPCTTRDITVTQETTVACVDNTQRIFCIESGRIEEDGRARTRRESNE